MRQPFSVRTLSLRSLLIVPFVIQVVLAVAVTGYLALANGEIAVQRVAEELRTEIQAHILSQLDNYLSTPQRINRINVNAVANRELDLGNLAQLERHFWQQAQDFAIVDFLYYGSIDGEFAGAGWPLGRDRPMQRHRVRAEAPLKLRFFDTNEQGDTVAERPGIDNFDVTQRPWFQAAVTAGKPTWGPVFTYQAFPAVAIPAVVPVFTDEGQVQGVLASNFFLPQISDFLKSLQVGESGQTFIVDHEGQLIASSTLAQPFRLNAQNQAERIEVANATDLDPVLAAAGATLMAQPQAILASNQAAALQFETGGDRYFLQAERFRDGFGLDWWVAVVMPEMDFLAPIEAHRQFTLGLCTLAFGGSLLVGVYTSRWIAAPVQRLGQATTEIAAGDFQQNLPISGLRELDALSRAFSHMSSQLQASFEQLNQQAYQDILTGLPNRAALMQKLEHCIAQVQQNPPRNFAVLFADIDNFKLINDSLGHLVGDDLLVAVAHRLKSQLPSHTAIFRFGGDEFVMVQHSVHGVEDATRLSNLFFKSLQLPFLVGDREIFITASIGIVLGTLRHTTAVEFLRDADTALYRAKAEGKARYEVFTDQMHQALTQRLQLETALRRSIRAQQMTLAYQPIVDLSTTDLVGVEALCRWHHPELGQISPEEFIPLAEETGLIIELERWMLHQACAQMRHWQRQFPAVDLASISVNLSPLHIMHPQFLTHIDQVLRATGLNSGALKIEVTESLMLQNPALVRARLERLRESGVHISLDDFGTGYSSLSYLHQLPFDSLKIDRSFVALMSANADDQSLVQAIIAMAASLNIDTVAEGIETPQQLGWIQALGCQYGQGYGLAQPMAAHQISQYLNTYQTRS